MARRNCPTNYEAHSDACYYFGGHASYDAALSHCKSVDARLADVDPRNQKYIKEQLIKHGGNDNWIGSYIARSKLTKRSGDDCPMLKGQSSRSGNFDKVNCNSAYPYICQKYGNTPYLNKVLFGQREQFGPDGEREIPVTVPAKEETTAAIEESTDIPVIASVLAVVVFIIVALILRYICNQRRRKATRDKIKELQRTESKATSLTKPKSVFSSPTFNEVSRTNTIDKQFSLPGEELKASASTIIRRPSGQDIYRRRSLHNEEQMLRNNQNRRSSKSINVTEGMEYFGRRSFRSESQDGYSHGRYSPPPSYGAIDRRNSFHSRNRRRSLSRIEGRMEETMERHFASSRSSSPESHFSETSRITEATYRNSLHGRQGRRRQRFISRHHRQTSPNEYADERVYRSRGDLDHNDTSRHRTVSAFEQYAGARPPSPARNTMPRYVERGEFGDYPSFVGRSRTYERRFYDDVTHDRLPDSIRSTYVPQITTAWNPDLQSLEHFNNSSTFEIPRTVSQLRQGPIRVNRHIHDIEDDRTKRKPRPPSPDSDHVYESLDETKKETKAMPLHSRTSPQRQDYAFNRDVNRASGRSRASMRSRGLPATPYS